MFAGVSSTVEPHAQIPKCVDGIGDGIVKSDRSVVVLHHFGLGRTIGFQAAVSDTSSGKHPEFSHQLIVRSRCPTLHALRVLRSHGMNDAALQTIYKAVVVAKLTYTLPAYGGALRQQTIDVGSRLCCVVEFEQASISPSGPPLRN